MSADDERTSTACDRCRRITGPEAKDFVHWEAIERPDGSVGMICPDCLTGAEEQQLDEAVMNDDFVEAVKVEHVLDQVEDQTAERGPPDLN